MIRIVGTMGGSPFTYLKRFRSQIITSKVPSTSGRASRCILEVSIDKVHTKVRPQRSRARKSRANSVFTQTLHGYFDVQSYIYHRITGVIPERHYN